MKQLRVEKRRFFLLLTAVIFTTIITGISTAAEKASLTPDYLASGKWEIPGRDSCTGKVEFTKGGRFTMFRDCGHIDEKIDGSGVFTIKGGKLNLKFENASGDMFKKGETIEWVLSDKDSLEYRWYLAYEDDNPFAINLNSYIKEGESLSINGLNAVSMGSVSGIVTTNLKIREEPNSAAEEIHYTYNKDYQYITAKSLDKGSELTIYARTKEKDKVGKWNNYWYYVGMPYDDGEGGDPVLTGWVFGEFVKIK